MSIDDKNLEIVVTEEQQSSVTVYKYVVWTPGKEVVEAGKSKNPEKIKKKVLEAKKKWPEAEIIDEAGVLTEEKKISTNKKKKNQLIPPLKMGQFGSQTGQDVRAFDAAAMSTFGSGGSSGFGSLPGLSIDLDRLTKKARDTSGMSEKRRKEYESLTEKQKAEKKCSGVFGTKRLQAMTDRENLPSEVEVGRGLDNNAYIIIGNDRVSKPHTGYGGKGHTQCDAIDIVAGLGGSYPKEVEKTKSESGDVIESSIKTNPNFYVDSARIYISQKTDVDKNFGLCEFAKKQNGFQDDKDDDIFGKYGAKSAVAIKADNVRLIGRESIRIVTGTDAKNSQSGATRSKCGIELVAMNEVEELQPLVLGDNLVEALEKILERMKAFEDYMHAHIQYQMEFNRAAQSHTHMSPFFINPTMVSETMTTSGFKMDVDNAVKTERSTLVNTINIAGVRKKYLTPGDEYINSKLNKTN